MFTSAPHLMPWHRAVARPPASIVTPSPTNCRSDQRIRAAPELWMRHAVRRLGVPRRSAVLRGAVHAGAQQPATMADLITCAHAADGGTDRMTRFLARRLLNYVVLLALASFLAFRLASALVPSTREPPAAATRRPPADVIEAKAAELGLDKPILVRYAHWASGVVRGDFGTTIGGQPVTDELWRRIGVSLRLLVIGVSRRHRHRRGRRRMERHTAVQDQRPRHHDRVAADHQHTRVRDGPLLILSAERVNSVLGFQLFEYIGETSPNADRRGVGPVRRPPTAPGAADVHPRTGRRGGI